MNTLAIIPARGGSKSIPKKNIIKFCGIPLLAYSIESAIKSTSIDRVVVTSDNKEIIKIALEYGAEVPFTRPKDLAEDDTPDLPVFIHCLNYLKEKEGYEVDILNLNHLMLKKAYHFSGSIFPFNLIFIFMAKYINIFFHKMRKKRHFFQAMIYLPHF